MTDRPLAPGPGPTPGAREPEPEFLDTAQCPLCAGPNRCAMADPDSDDAATPCWCTWVVIGPEVLMAVPPAARDRVCVCAECSAG